MKIFNHTCLFLISLISFNLNSKITIGETPEPAKTDTSVKSKINFKSKREKDGYTELVFSSIWNNSNRKLVENGDLYGSPLLKRADEKSQTSWGYGFGFRSYIKKNIAFESGLSYLKNGESYKFTGADSTYTYQTTYSYIAMPLKFLYTYGENIRFLAGGGITPQMFVKYRQDQQWENYKHEKSNATIKSTTDFNTFALSAVINCGVQLKYSPSWSIFVMPEYRWQLNSSLSKIDSYKHYARVFSLNFGLVYQL